MIYRECERETVYLQGFEPWDSMKYAGNSTVAQSGCGLLSITHAALELDEFADYDPTDLIDFMRKYSEKGKGTLRKGIPAGLEHLGYEYIKQYEGDMVGGDMKPFFEELKKGDRIAIILFNNPTRNENPPKVTPAPDGTVWTSKGHYCFAGGMKYVKSRYYLQIKDSSGRHCGWYSYTKSMKGCIRCMWTAKIPQQVINLPARGYFQKGDRDPEVRKIQSFLKKYGFVSPKIKCLGNYLTKTTAGVRKFQKKYNLTVDGKFGAECLRKYIELTKKGGSK